MRPRRYLVIEPQADRPVRSGCARAGGVPWLRGAILAGLLWGAAMFSASCAAAETPAPAGRSEYNVKAAFLYSFGRYVDWPAQAFEGDATAFVIGVLGDDPFGETLDRIASLKKVHDRPIQIRRIRSMADYQPCHMLFVAATAAEEERVAATRILQGKPVLLVGEKSGFVTEGGTINFVVDQETIRFEINVENGRTQKLTINAKLLSLARPANRTE